MGTPVSVLDVAAYILGQQGRMSTWKLQKLCYYSQAWSLVWDDEPLFPERIEAWANGPVVPALYYKHRGRFELASIDEGDPERLDADQKETVDVVLDTYGGKAGVWLSELTHQERPWVETRRRAGLSIGERGEAEIPLDDMAEYYGGLYDGQEA